MHGRDFSRGSLQNAVKTFPLWKHHVRTHHTAKYKNVKRAQFAQRQIYNTIITTYPGAD